MVRIRTRNQHQTADTMALNALGKHYREGIGIVEIVRMFSTGKKACDWLAGPLWPEGPVCPSCGSHNVQSNIRHPQAPHVSEAENAHARDGHDHSPLDYRNCGLPDDNQHQGYQQHEAAPRAGHCAISMASAEPLAQGV